MYRRRLFVSCLLTCIVGMACSGPPAPTAPEVVTGVVVDVTSRGLGEVTGFVLKDGEETYGVEIDRNIEYGFPLDHLNEHRATGDPIRVELERQGRRWIALSLQDA